MHIGRRKLPLKSDVDVETIAAQTTGFTGADLANLVNEAALLAGRGNKGESCGGACVRPHIRVCVRTCVCTDKLPDSWFQCMQLGHR